MSQEAWAKKPWFWVALGGVAAVFVVVGVVSAPKNHPQPAPQEPDRTQEIIQQAQQAPAAGAGSGNSGSAEKQYQQSVRQLYFASDQPRLIIYRLRGTTTDATITYTATGGGTGQRDVQVLREWRVVTARLRPEDFAYISAQNGEDYGTVQCQIIEHTPYGGQGDRADDRVGRCLCDRRVQRVDPLDAEMPPRTASLGGVRQQCAGVQ